MPQYLLVDFGTSRVKSAIADLETGQIKAVSSQPACLPSDDSGEIAISQLQGQFAGICRHYEAQEIPFDGIMLCCQMHGFAVLTQDCRPASGYITWKDERSTTPLAGESSWDLFNRQFGKVFRGITGMRPRPGFPVFNLLHMARQGSLPQQCRVVSLAEILCLVSDDFTGLIHPTMLAGLGIYDINRKQTVDEFLQFIFTESGCVVECCQSAGEAACGGYWHRQDGRKIPIFVGVGDHQCTVLGAGNRSAETLSINVGTGSQVSAIDFPAAVEQTEQRPYFANSTLTTITHIPAGRALVEFIGFLEEAARLAGGSSGVFWDKLAEIDCDAALSAEIEFELGIFNSCWRYQKGGAIHNIHEGGFTVEKYLAGLLGSFCRQYREAVQYIDPLSTLKNCILSGGIPHKLPQIAEILSVQLGRTVKSTQAIDEALIGLRTLAQVASGNAYDYRQAMAISYDVGL